MNEALAEALVPLVSLLVPISLFVMVIFIVWFGSGARKEKIFTAPNFSRELRRAREMLPKRYWK